MYISFHKAHLRSSKLQGYRKTHQIKITYSNMEDAICVPITERKPICQPRRSSVKLNGLLQLPTVGPFAKWNANPACYRLKIMFCLTKLKYPNSMESCQSFEVAL